MAYLNRNLNAIPVFQVDGTGNLITPSQFTTLRDSGGANILTIAPVEDYDLNLIRPLLGTYAQTAWFDGAKSVRARGDTSGLWIHAPVNTVDTSLSGSIATSGATASVAFVNTARQEVINASTGTLWARWGAAPAVNGAGSFPIAAGGSYSTDRTNGTLQIMSTAAGQNYTVNRFS